MPRSTVCIVCGNPTTNGSRCVTCNRGFQRAAHNPQYDDPRWRKHSKARRAEHVAEHGMVCPGYRRAPHQVTRLTLDHPIPLVLGGALIQGDETVMCDSCNTRKRHDQTPTRRVRTVRPA